jgi:hypothetical protein
MSIYGHYTQQFNGCKIIFPENSFFISEINFYKDNCLDITYETELTMELETDNEYNISIKNNNNKIGYVPNTKIKEICKKHITEPLKIINIKIINGNFNICVMPKCFYDDL